MSQNNTHHGGAWKVAYADFVTAMMALFMVLWLTSQDTEMRKELAQYFQDPYNTPMDNSMGVIKNDSASGQSTEGQRKGKANIDDIKVLHDMAQEFMRLLNIDNVNPSDDPVEIETTSDGLRVTLYDRDAHPFFVENAADFTPWGKFVIEQMSWLVQRHFFSVRVDGHVAAGFNA
ncbi:MAG: flagellar motor protein MotB, partial [Verrucomicrobiota bacterium]